MMMVVMMMMMVMMMMILTLMTYLRSDRSLDRSIDHHEWSWMCWHGMAKTPVQLGRWHGTVQGTCSPIFFTLFILILMSIPKFQSLRNYPNIPTMYLTDLREMSWIRRFWFGPIDVARHGITSDHLKESSCLSGLILWEVDKEKQNLEPTMIKLVVSNLCFQPGWTCWNLCFLTT